jgi:cytosine deaminase
MPEGSPRVVVAGVRTPDGERTDLFIEGETLQAIAPSRGGSGPAVLTIRGEGLLALPALIDIHAHLDKAYLGEELPPGDGTLEGAIAALRDRKRRYTPDEVAARATRRLRSTVAAGATRIRSHVDIDPAAGLVGLEGVRRAAAACGDLCEVQLVPFPQEGVLAAPGVRRLMEQAVEHGVHAVGGMPHREHGVEAQQAHVAFCFDLAVAADLDVDMHVDETDDGHVRTLEMVVDEAVARGWEGRVTVGHVCSLAAADDAYAARVIRKCREARVSVVANPATNLVLQGRGDRGLVRRGLTRVGELRAAGVNVCFGQDNVVDPFYPFGGGDMLQIAFLGCHAAHLTGREDVRFALACVTEAPARVWRAEPYGLRPGARADLALYRAGSWDAALRAQRPPELVLFRGRPVARTLTSTTVGREGLSLTALAQEASPCRSG